MKKNNDYYIGLDMGTNSVGWAVTDTKGRLQRFNKKDMWGSRLFDEAKTAAERRTFRTSRRRYERVRQRIEFLQDIFAPIIAKKDFEFFSRLNESKFYPEDKKTDGRFALFNDADFTDKDYFKLYPTIYHLRAALLKPNHITDPRLLYLAIHHIVKNRGHFLFASTDMESIRSFQMVYTQLSEHLKSINSDFELPVDAQDKFAAILLNEKLSNRDKKKQLKELCPHEDKRLEYAFKAIIGEETNVKDIFGVEEYDGDTKKVINFEKADYDEVKDEIESIIKENIHVLNTLKAVYDWTVLTKILGEYTYVSELQVALYDAHAKDLRILKSLIKKYAKSQYADAFRHENVKGNYANYVGSTNYDNKQPVIDNPSVTQEDINKYFAAILFGITPDESDRESYQYITERLHKGEALPKLRTKANSVLPHQIHKIELEKILTNAARNFPFLQEKDSSGYTAAQKIVKIMTFRIPYYVGPLNTYHHVDQGGHAWMVRKAEGKITPWNFDEKVDREASAEKFIRNMTNKCTYLIGKDVIPKQSLLYSRYKVLNELNNLKVNGVPISVALKQKIYEELFKKQVNVTFKQLKTFLKAQGEDADEIILSGVDEAAHKFTNNLQTYHKFQAIFGDKIEFEPQRSMVEDIIRWKCLMGDDIAMWKHKIEKEYGDQLSEEQLKKITRLNFNGWSRLSQEFLTDVPGVDIESGEVYSGIMDALWKTNENIMQLLSSRFTFAEEVKKQNQGTGRIEKITYDEVMKDTYLSPAVKRSVWQAITLVEEIRKIRKADPKRIFVEMTRQPDAIKERKLSRRTQLLNIYKAIGNDIAEYEKEHVSTLIKQLESKKDEDLRRKKLYLYFTQMGRCMYTGERIDLSSLLHDTNSNIYDIDHIYPRSLTKDDSLDNTVLCKKEINLRKGNKNLHRVFTEKELKKQYGYWKALKDKKLISERKFSRLMRTTDLTAAELAGFISRQLVETSQMVKATADILEKIYPNVTIVYVKARTVSDFRHDYDLPKVRVLNDCHHAHDAYLNIVVGNVYYEKFTKSPFNFIQNQKGKGDIKYNLYRLFDKDVKVGDRIIWNTKEDLARVKATLERDTVNVILMPVERHGKFYDATIQKKSTTKETMVLPLKGSDERLQDISKYGYYIKPSGMSFMVVQHEVKGKKRVTIEQALLIYKNKLKSEKDYVKYCEDFLKLQKPKVLFKNIKFSSKILLDGYPYLLKGRTGKKITLTDAQSLFLSNRELNILKRVTKISDDIGHKVKSRVKITDEEWATLWKSVVEQNVKGKFRNRRGVLNDILQGRKIKLSKDEEARFNELDSKDQEEYLSQILLERFLRFTTKEKTDLLLQVISFSSNTRGVNLCLIGGSERTGTIAISNNITDHSVVLINESPTGLFTNRTVLNRP
ncbi:type II CRISPR RNA-guided endonuclease Cas9 [Negativicoccus succinicivorans]|uniref:type II CRISPR RNA-guided endonuclease Cas9 n=1 Tax=Negativicoccus succinicivorans TaxID=620903 RepID=UPI0028D8E5FA|nr:type II CRISPR RNA-guided endonuclease Cas9 [Negativicoccus succinicivorans]